MSNPSFAALLKPANEIVDVPLPPAGKAILKIADVTYAPPKEDGKNPYLTARIIYSAVHPDSGNDPADVNPRDFETIFHRFFLGDARANAALRDFMIALGADAAALAPIVEDADSADGYNVNPELVALAKGREIVADVKHGVNKMNNTAEVRLFNFAAL